MKERIAVLFSGLSYQENYAHWNGKVYGINFLEYVDSMQRQLLDKFSDYDVDIYLSTNDARRKELEEIYHPVSVYWDNDHHRVHKTIKGLELIQQNVASGIEYRFIVVTRFDIYFTDPLDNIDVTKLNLFSVLEHSGACDDNFHLFPTTYLNKFHELLCVKAAETNYSLPTMHYLIHSFHECFKVHYIKNEFKPVRELSSFRLKSWS